MSKISASRDVHRMEDAGWRGQGVFTLFREWIVILEARVELEE